MTTPTCILVHPVGTTCNIACGYCFHRNTDMQDFSRKMSTETFLNFYNRWMNVIPDHTECEIIWHGGEPTLRGIDFYKEVLSESKILTPKNKTVRHCIQTNGVTVETCWAELFKKHDVLVGISIDGPANLHNRLRVLRNGTGTFSKAIDAYKLLEKWGVTSGIVVVVNQQNVEYPDQIMNFMLEYGIKRLQLSPCLELNSCDKDDYSVTINQYERFICRLYDLWIQSNDPEISIGFIDDIIDHLLGRKQHNCMLGDLCNNFAVLDWTGDIKTCDGMRVRQQTITKADNQAIDDPVFMTSWERYHLAISKERFNTCHECQWYKICHGGCPYHWPENGPTKTAFCEAHKRIFTHIALSITRIYGG